MLKTITGEQIKAGNFIVEEYSRTNTIKYELILAVRKPWSSNDYLIICYLNFLHSQPRWHYVHIAAVFGVLDLVDLNNNS